MEGLFLPLGLILIFIYRLYQQHKNNQNDKEFELDLERRRKIDLKNLIEQRESRENMDEYDEDSFWEIIQKTYNRSENNYKNNLGLLKDSLSKLTPKELIEIDNLINRLFKDFISQDLYAASNIILKTPDIGGTYLLMNLFMSRGRVFFKNACINPNLIIGKEIVNFENRMITDLIDELYLIKTNKLIPLPEIDLDFEIKGEKWNQKELPSKYSELWMEYA